MLLNNRFLLVKPYYNWFADYEIAPLREEALKIFKKTYNLYKNIEFSHTKVEDYPQQDLITFMQLFSHTKRMIESLVSFNDEIDQASINAAFSSLDGMNFTFDEISKGIRDVLNRGPWNQNL